MDGRMDGRMDGQTAAEVEIYSETLFGYKTLKSSTVNVISQQFRSSNIETFNYAGSSLFVFMFNEFHCGT